MENVYVVGGLCALIGAILGSMLTYQYGHRPRVEKATLQMLVRWARDAAYVKEPLDQLWQSEADRYAPARTRKTEKGVRTPIRTKIVN